MNIIFDLDGTLVDASDRMYRLFNDLAPVFGYKKEEYWSLKRNAVSHEMMFDSAHKISEYDLFHRLWMSKIETPEYLQLDLLYPNVIESLEMLSANNKLLLLTARQYKDRLNQELNQIGLANYFAEVLVAGRNDKETLLKRFLSNVDDKERAIYISDVGKDILAGKKVGIKTIAVTYGFMNRERLAAYWPDYLADSIEMAADIIVKRLPQDAACKFDVPISEI